MQDHHLQLNLAKSNFTVGVDLHEDRIKQLKNGIDKTLEVDEKELKTTNLSFTRDITRNTNCNTYIFTAPISGTPSEELVDKIYSEIKAL